MSPSDSNPIRDALRDGIARAVAVVGLCGMALIHLLDLPGKFEETPYMAWMYIGLIAASLVLAGALVCLGSAVLLTRAVGSLEAPRHRTERAAAPLEAA
jgi:hypothetical protein